MPFAKFLPREEQYFSLFAQMTSYINDAANALVEMLSHRDGDYQEYVRRISQRYAMLRSGEMARNARTISPTQAASLVNEEQTTPPAPTYERAVFAIRLPDGRLQLVSQ